MKRFIRVLMAALLVMTFAGCTAKSNPKATISMAKSEYEYDSQIGFSVELTGIGEDEKGDVSIVSAADPTAIIYRHSLTAGTNSLSTDAMPDGKWIMTVKFKDKELASKQFTVKEPQYTEIRVTKEKQDDGSFVVTFSELPLSVDQLKKIDLSDEYISAATLIAVLCEYEYDSGNCLTMIDYLDGPAEIGNVDKNQIDQQFSQYPYVARSYFEGATPDNSYMPASYSITLFENAHSRVNEGYVTLRAISSGADNSREITLKQQGSTGNWYAHNYIGILAGIKAPKDEDPWN